MLWWRGNRTSWESISTLHWRPDDRITNGYPDSMLYASPTLCTRRWGGSHSSRWTRVMQSLTVVEIDAIAWKPSHDSECTGKVLDMSHIDLYEISLSIVNSRSARLLTSWTVSWSCLFCICVRCVRSQLGGLLRVLYPWPNDPGISLE